ncbi:hypothetical protein KCU64_g1512, partial [Aureobasidium melanogenum]
MQTPETTTSPHHAFPTSRATSLSNCEQRPRYVNTGTWLPEEDQRLREAILKYGSRWVHVASDVGTRNGDQCMKRWNEKLNPALNHSSWTAGEEELLLSLVESCGRNWKFLADTFFENRASLALKNSYSLLLRRQKRRITNQQAAEASSNRITQQTTQPGLSSRSNASTSPSAGASNVLNYYGDAEATSSLNHNLQPVHPVSSGLSSRMLLNNPSMSETCNTSSFNQPMRGDELQYSAAAPKTARAMDLCVDQSLIQRQDSFLDGLGWPCMPKSTASRDYDTDNRGLMEFAGMDNFSSFGYAERTNVDTAGFDIGQGDGCEERGADDEGVVEYSIKAQRKKLKKLMSHMMDAAMSESAGWMADDDEVTLEVRLIS